MNILSVDTSTKTFSLAVSRDERVIRFRNIYLDKVLESSIIPAIDKILKDSRLKLKDIDGFAIGLGPGSFTSLRVGLSTVKAFAMATAKPVVGISSLDVLAENVGSQNVDEICALVDARRNQIYACIYSRHCELYLQPTTLKAKQSHPLISAIASSPPVNARAPRNDGHSLKRKTDYLLTSLDDLLDRVHGKTLFVGDGVAVYRDAIKKKYIEAKRQGALCTAAFAPQKNWLPQAKKLASLAYGRFKKKEYDNFESLVPIYLYAQDCQVQK